MAPVKKIPISPDSLHQQQGITFSMMLVNAPEIAVKTPLSPPPSPSQHYHLINDFSIKTKCFKLQSNVHQITSNSLKQRMFQHTKPLSYLHSIKSQVGRKRKTSYPPSTQICKWCLSNKTAQWRKGPTGPKTLCNACGLEYAKRIRLGSSSFAD
jgi:hypothetical protein